MIAEDFIGYAGHAKIAFDCQVLPEVIQLKVQKMMSSITLNCIANGARLIGHVKCFVETSNNNYMMCSVTTHDGKANCSNNITVSSDNLDIIINVLLYGLDEDIVEEVVRMNIQTIFPEASSIIYEDQGHHHEHDHHSHRGHDHNMIKFEGASQ
jgi:hypothetical protein